MTKADLMDWITAHGCNTQRLEEHQAKVIYFYNPKTGGKAWLGLPFNDNRLNDFTICRICVRLGIEIPNYVNYMKDINDDIERKHGKGNSDSSNM